MTGEVVVGEDLMSIEVGDEIKIHQPEYLITEHFRYLEATESIRLSSERYMRDAKITANIMENQKFSVGHPGCYEVGRVCI